MSMQQENHMNVRLAEAPAFGQSIFAYDTAATGADAYRSLADEVLARCQQASKPASQQASKP